MELQFKIFCAKKDSNQIMVYESQLRPDLLEFLVPQLKELGFEIPENSSLSIFKRGSCYIIEINSNPQIVAQTVVFFEYKLI